MVDGVGGFNFENFVTNGSYHHADNGRQQVEEAIWQIDKGRYPQHCALRHAACVPWYEHRCDGYGILDGAAQQTSLIALSVIDVLEHIA